jgi:mannose-6-phosphate isomerase-like protein (cupin superfamily)
MIHTSLLDHVAFRTERFYKGTIFASDHMLVGIDCLNVQQKQEPHHHTGHDKMYFVHAGIGEFLVGNEQVIARVGDVVWAPADTVHAVTNIGTEPLIMLIVMAPFPS